MKARIPVPILGGMLAAAFMTMVSSACLHAGAQFRLGSEPMKTPDSIVVRGYVCAGDDDAARIYLNSPEYAWMGADRERYIVDAKLDKLRGACPCPAKGCPGVEVSGGGK